MRKLVSIMLVLGMVFCMAMPTLAWDEDLAEVEMKEEKVLPGDFLYPLKRLGETIRLAVSLSEQTRARLLSEYAERRLDELNTLAERGQVADEVISDLLANFDNLIDRLGQIDRATCVEQYGISAEKLDKIMQKAEDKQALVQRLAEKHLELASKLEEKLDNLPEQAEARLQKALENAQMRFERIQERIRDRIQTRLQEMDGEGNGEGLRAMEQLQEKFQNKMETIQNKLNERLQNRRGGNK